ncbi:NF-kappa-B inhibitor zeta isoform X2 [Pleurodeles waltl]
MVFEGPLMRRDLQSRDLIRMSCTGVKSFSNEPCLSPSYSSSCSSPCSPYTDPERSFNIGNVDCSDWNLCAVNHGSSRRKTKSTFQGVRVRNSVKELLIHLRNNKQITSRYGGKGIMESLNFEPCQELKTVFSNTKRSYEYSLGGPVSKRPAFQRHSFLAPSANPDSIHMENNYQNIASNSNCEVLQNIINIKDKTNPLSLNTVQVNWMSTLANNQKPLEEQYHEVQVVHTHNSDGSNPQTLEQCKVHNFPLLATPGLQTPIDQHSVPDCSQLGAHSQLLSSYRGLTTSFCDVLHWPDQSVGSVVNEMDYSSDVKMSAQPLHKASTPSHSFNLNNALGSRHSLFASYSISQQPSSVDENQAAATRPNKSFFHWQLDQEESKIASISREQLLAQDSDGDTFLHIAVAQGRRALSYVLARKMAAINELDIKEHNNQSALQVAVAANQHLIVQDLVGLGAQVNTADCWGRTPLHVCAEKGHSQVLQVIQKGVIERNQYVDAEATNYEGITALHCAVMSHNAAIHDLPRNLQPHSPEVQERLLKTKRLVDTIRSLIHMGASVETRDLKSGRSALHLAAEEANVDLLRLFLDLPNSVTFVNAKAYNGNTALHVVASLQHRFTQLDAVRLLMRKGADPSMRNLENEQPIHLVADGPVGEQIKRTLKGKVIKSKSSLLF